MSGYICPDCNCIAFEEINLNQSICRICGWKGKNPPRKSVGPKMGKAISERTKNLLALRQNGRLFYFRIKLKGDKNQRWVATASIMELLELTKISGDELLIFYLMSELDKNKMNLLKKIVGVSSITIF